MSNKSSALSLVFRSLPVNRRRRRDLALYSPREAELALRLLPSLVDEKRPLAPLCSDALVRKHGLAPLLGSRGNPEYQKEFVQNSLRSEEIEEEMRKVFGGFFVRGLLPVLFGAAGCAWRHYKDPGERIVRRIDVLLRTGEIGSAQAVLLAQGYTRVDEGEPSPGTFRTKARCFQLAKYTQIVPETTGNRNLLNSQENGLEIRLHSELLWGFEGNRSFVDDVLARARDLEEVHGAYLPDPEDELLIASMRLVDSAFQHSLSECVDLCRIAEAADKASFLRRGREIGLATLTESTLWWWRQLLLAAPLPAKLPAQLLIPRGSEILNHGQKPGPSTALLLASLLGKANIISGIGRRLRTSWDGLG